MVEAHQFPQNGCLWETFCLREVVVKMELKSKSRKASDRDRLLGSDYPSDFLFAMRVTLLIIVSYNNL
jgi:hypothetical protein